MEHSPRRLTRSPLSSERGEKNTVGELGAGNEYQWWAVLIASAGGVDHTCWALQREITGFPLGALCAPCSFWLVWRYVIHATEDFFFKLISCLI